MKTLLRVSALSGVLASLVLTSGCASFSAMIVTAAGVAAVTSHTNAPKYELTYSTAAEMSYPTWSTMKYVYTLPVNGDYGVIAPAPELKSKIRFSGETQHRAVLTVLRKRPGVDSGMIISFTQSTVDYSFEGGHDEARMDTLDWGPFVTIPLHDDVLFCDILVTFGTGRADFDLLDDTDPNSSDGDSETVQRFRIGASLVYRPIPWVQLGCGASAESMALGSLFGFSMGPAEPVGGFFAGADTSMSFTPHLFLGAKW